MNTIDHACIKIALAFEAAGATTIGQLLRSLPPLSSQGARETWLLAMREATTVAIDAGFRISKMPLSLRTHEAAQAWRNVARALDTHGAEIAMALGALDAVEPAPVVKTRRAA